jgi:lipopolysaccharide biosynthesis protein
MLIAFIFCKYIKIYRHKIIYDNKQKIISNNLLVYAAHISREIVPAFIIENANFFIKEGYQPIFVITFSSSVNFESIVKNISSQISGARIFVRKNYGKDFGSFKDVLSRIENKNSINKIILQNDSLIGPLYKSNFYRDLLNIKADIKGISESYDHLYHLQSSFILVNNKYAIDCLFDFFKNYAVFKSRIFVVLFGEIGLTQFFISKGMTAKPLVSIFGPLAHCENSNSNIALNPQHCFGSELFLDFNIPFLKRELLSRNPEKVQIKFKEILNKVEKSKYFLLESAFFDRN